MKLKIGFIGVGSMGLSHVKSMHVGCAQHAEAVAICSRNEANIKKALEVAPKATVFKEENALINSDLDAVFISTPNFLHVPLALQALAAGKHVFMEKPVGIHREECLRLLAAAEKSDRVLMVGHELRYSSYFQKIKELVAAGEIGKPRMVWCRELRGPFQKKSDDWIQDWRKSGGALVDKNCHHFDLMNWWAGSRPKRVCAFGGVAAETRIAGEHQILDHATVSFDYENGVLGTLQLCLFAPDLQGEDLEMGIVGDEGVIQTRISKIQLLVWRKGGKEPEICDVAAKRGEGWGNHLGFDEIHEAFIAAVLEKKRPLTTVRECLDGTMLAIAAEESIRTGSVVEMWDVYGK
jgi:predicted dehydrogenase